MRSRPSKQADADRRTTLWVHEEGFHHVYIKTKLSEYISAPVVEVAVGEGAGAKVFYIHQTLLEAESDRMAAGLKSCWLEGQQRKYKLPEEDPELFKYFVEFIYRDDWIMEEEQEQEPDYKLRVLIKTARLYTMGERLLASSFKDEALLKFKTNEALLEGVGRLDDDTICDLLKIAGNELPDMRNFEDIMKSYIIAIAVTSLKRLQKCERFKDILWEHEELGRAIALKAGSRKTWYHDKHKGTIELHRVPISWGVWGEVIPEKWPNDGYLEDLKAQEGQDVIPTTDP